MTSAPATTKYTAANGGQLYNEGEKKVYFKNVNDSTIAMAEFQCMEVKKPLASVARIVDKGNKVIFGSDESYILNIETGEKIVMQRERGNYVIEIEYDESRGGKANSGFRRPS